MHPICTGKEEIYLVAVRSVCFGTHWGVNTLFSELQYLVSLLVSSRPNSTVSSVTVCCTASASKSNTHIWFETITGKTGVVAANLPFYKRAKKWWYRIWKIFIKCNEEEIVGMKIVLKTVRERMIQTLLIFQTTTQSLIEFSCREILYSVIFVFHLASLLWLFFLSFKR